MEGLAVGLLVGLIGFNVGALEDGLVVGLLVGSTGLPAVVVELVVATVVVVVVVVVLLFAIGTPMQLSYAPSHQK